MAIADRHAEAGRERVEIDLARLRIERRSQQLGVEETRRPPFLAGAPRLVLQHGQVEADALADQHRVVDEAIEGRLHRGERRRVCDHRVTDAVNRRRMRRNRHAGIDQRVEGLVGEHASGLEAHGAHLHEAGAGDVETGRLGVEHDRIELRERRKAVDPTHGDARRM